MNIGAEDRFPKQKLAMKAEFFLKSHGYNQKLGKDYYSNSMMSVLWVLQSLQEQQLTHSSR